MTALSVVHVFDYDFVRNALIAGTIVAITAGVVGYFVVLRGLSFAGHAISHVGFSGATGAVALGLPAVSGLLGFALVGAAAMGIIGERARGRDVAIGIVLAWALGLGVLFLSLYKGYATEAYSLLFGEILGVTKASVFVTALASAVALAALALLYRPLLFASIDPQGASARGVPIRTISMAFMLVLALAVSAAAQVVGVLLIFALLVTPAAIAERLTAKPALAMLLSVGFALAFTWGGLLLALYVAYPVSFFITSLAFAAYLGVCLLRPSRTPVSRSLQQQQAVEARSQHAH